MYEIIFPARPEYAATRRVSKDAGHRIIWDSINYFYMYMLKCSDGSYYVGHTDNIEARVSQHKHGLIENCYTSTRLPVEVVFVQNFGTREEAFAAERRIKKWSRKKKEALITQDWQLISLLAKKKFSK